MKIRLLESNDIYKYKEDIIKCCEDNPQIFDIQSEVDPTNYNSIIGTINYYVENDHCMAQGILTPDERFLAGLVLYEDMRVTSNGSSAKIHFISNKDIWGSDFHIIYPSILQNNIYDVVYGVIPSNCRGIISLCKKLGFKKTGYIPRSIPYKNLKGEVKMYDQYIYVWEKPFYP